MKIDFQPIDQTPSQIDFQPLEGQDQTTQETPSQSMIPEFAKEAFQQVGSRPELQPLGMGGQQPVSSVAGQAVQAAGQTLAAPIRTGATLMQAPDIGGEAAADIGGSIGYPKTGAAVGTAIQMAPYVVGAKAGWDALHSSLNPTVQGMMNSTKELGPQYTAQNEAIGIQSNPVEFSSKQQFEEPYQYPSQLTKTKYGKGGEPISNPGGSAFTRPRVQVGIESPSAQPLPSTTPIKYSNDPGTFINQANMRMDQFGTQLHPQELYDYQAGLDSKIDSGQIPKFGEDGQITPLYAQASAARSKAVNLLNKVAETKLPQANLPQGTIPTRSGLNQAYSDAARRQQMQSLLLKYMKYGTEGAGILGGAGYGIKKAYDLFRGQ